MAGQEYPYFIGLKVRAQLSDDFYTPFLNLSKSLE